SAHIVESWHGHDQTHGGAGAPALPRGAARRARWTAAAVLRRLLRDLRSRQRRRHRPGAAAASRPAPVPPGAQRAGDGAHRRRVRAHAESPRHAGLHELDRPRRHEHGHRRRARDDQPPPRPPPAGRRLRRPGARPGAAAARGAVGGRRLRQRRIPPRLPLLRPHHAPRAGDPRHARRAARPHEPGRHRRSHARVPAGRPDRGVRLPGGVPRRADLARAAPAALAEAVEAIRGARRPLVVAGGGVVYAEATEALLAFCDATGIPVGETQAGKGSLPYDHPSNLGAIGATGTFAANRFAAAADVVVGIGTRYSDFTTASKTAFQDPAVRFVNVNVADFDAAKHAGVRVTGDARVALEQLTHALRGFAVDDGYRAQAAQANREWDAEVARLYGLGH